MSDKDQDIYKTPRGFGFPCAFLCSSHSAAGFITGILMIYSLGLLDEDMNACANPL